MTKEAYKKYIIELIERIEDNRILKRIYVFIRVLI